MSDVTHCAFPRDKIAFTIDGKECILDVCRAMHQLDYLGKTVQEGDDIAYCEQFQKWVSSEVDAELSYSQAFALIPMINQAYELFKKKLPSLQPSPTTTDST